MALGVGLLSGRGEAAPRRCWVALLFRVGRPKSDRKVYQKCIENVSPNVATPRSVSKNVSQQRISESIDLLAKSYRSDTNLIRIAPLPDIPPRPCPRATPKPPPDPPQTPPRLPPKPFNSCQNRIAKSYQKRIGFKGEPIRS